VNCSNNDIEKIVKIYEKNLEGIPKLAGFRDDNGDESYGFYCGLLESENYNTEPKPFFQLLEIDQKIGWTNPEHVEYCIFRHKAIKIIEDQNVSLFILNLLSILFFKLKKVTEKLFFINFE